MGAAAASQVGQQQRADTLNSRACRHAFGLARRRWLLERISDLTWIASAPPMFAPTIHSVCLSTSRDPFATQKNLCNPPQAYRACFSANAIAADIVALVHGTASPL